MRHSIAVVLFAILGCTGCGGEPRQATGEAKVLTRTVEYRHGDAVLEGYLAWPENVTGRVPGVLIVHAWKGLGAFAREKAESIARGGRVAFALDMYGKGIRPETAAEAGKQAGIYRGDRALMRARAAAGLGILRAQANVDPDRIAAIGFCFGGGTVLELARSGAAISGVVSFHGNLDTPDPSDASNVKCAVLVLHGAADPHVPFAQVEVFTREMNDAGVDWRMVSYGGAVHSFTDPAAGDDPSRGAAYHAKSARLAFAAMEEFFAEVFAEQGPAQE